MSVFRDISIDQVTGDAQVVDGDLVLTSGPEAIRQDVESAWRMVQGEWFINDQDGLPYFGQLGSAIVGKGLSTAAIREFYRDAALACEGVTSVAQEEIVLDYDAGTRRLQVLGTVHYDEGVVTATVAQELR